MEKVASSSVKGLEMISGDSVEMKVAMAIRNLYKRNRLYYEILFQINKRFVDRHTHAASVVLDTSTRKITLILSRAHLKKASQLKVYILLRHELGHLEYNHFGILEDKRITSGLSQREVNVATDVIINETIPEFVELFPYIMESSAKLKQEIELLQKKVETGTPEEAEAARKEIDQIEVDNWLEMACISSRLRYIEELKEADFRKMTSLQLALILKKNNHQEESKMDDHSGHGRNDHRDDKDSRDFQRAVDNILKEAVEKSRGCGDVPDSIKMRLASLEKVNVDYSKCISSWLQSVRAHNKKSKSWSIEHRKYDDDAKGTCPGKTSKVVIAIDTSGSQWDQNIFSKVLGSLKRASQHFDEIWVVAGDTELKFKRAVRGGKFNLFEIEFVGGGGTDLQFAFDFARSIKADGIIVHTDGDFEKAPENYGIKTVYAITPGGKEVSGHKNLHL